MWSRQPSPDNIVGIPDPFFHFRLLSTDKLSVRISLARKGPLLKCKLSEKEETVEAFQVLVGTG